ncbi:MAG: glutathione S-transferase family protein [Kiloniellales bacterium]|nr:glutathione S-transferase family protein [Kiloniellales bacterium]
MVKYHLYDFLPSGNGYKVRLLLHFLGLDYDLTEVDILKGETRTRSFLEINPNGRIPVLQVQDGVYLSESGAILFYLAEGTSYLPQDTLKRAKVLQWMFFEQYSHEPYVAVARFIHEFEPEDSPRWSEIARLHDKGYEALSVVERQLAITPFLTGEKVTIADIALYAYSHVAEEGGFDLTAFPAMRQWCCRISELPGYVPISSP